MSATGSSDAAVEKFAPNGGTLVSIIGALVVAAVLVGWAIDIHRVPLWVPAVTLCGAVVLYASTVRPRVLVQDHHLVLRNMFSTTLIPLASVDEVAVRQVLAVRAGDNRYICAGVGRSLRQAMRGTAAQKAREQMGGIRGELEKAKVAVEPGMQYADFVELRIQELVNEDRVRRGVKKYSDDARELATQVRREPARLELGLLAATVLLVVVAFLLR